MPNTLSSRTIPALQRQQRWLDLAWAGYEAAEAEGREPKAESMRELFARDEMFRMAMNSAWRGGLKSCINGEAGCDEHVVSCLAHQGEAVAQVIASTSTGRAKDGSLWRIDRLAF